MFQLGLCHTIMVTNQNNKLVYNASSPDEYALIQMALYSGFKYLGMDNENNMILLDERQKKKYSYQLMDVLEFNSTRKRMSVILRDNQTNQIVLYCKGADNIIQQRLRQKDKDNYA